MPFLDPVAALLLCVLSLLCGLYINHGRKSNKYSNFPPGPRPLPIIGNLHILNLKKPYLTLKELSKTYGPVFSVQMGSRKAVVLAGYEAVKDALVNHAEEFGERARIPIFQQTDGGKGMILSHGENWKVMRRFTISTLRDFGMGKSTIEDKVIEECGYLAQHIESLKGKPCDNTMIMNASIANIIVAILLGHRFDYQEPAFLRLMSLINEGIRILGTPTIALFNAFPYLGFLLGEKKTLIRNVEEIDSFTKTVFMESLGQLDANNQRNFIDAFLVRQKEEKSNPETYFDDKNLICIVRNLFSAGMETTATTLRWGLLLMNKYPDVQQKVQGEIERVLGSAQAKYEDRKKMPYTNAVIHEIQRFANIVPMSIAHETAVDVTFKGYFIPQGTLVIPLLTSVLQDEAHFEKPMEFYPQHFLDSEGQFVKKEAFMPFSAGRRVCAGETLARMELFVFFTSLLQKFTFLPPPGVTDVDLTAAVGFTTPPMPHMICAVARS
ncbi:cytochrome P450 2K4-like [Ambystoma mexicanum]|uniref:cytochrome P450 2K4-like n=1 Tax=Ambystoma mexicanum TaxID=8296 RepID=UPI0037E9B60E